MLKSFAPAAALHPMCDEVRRHAFDACVGELTPDVVTRIDRHLVTCDACRRRVAADVRFLRVVRDAVSVEAAPAEFRERLLQSLQTRAIENAPA